MDISRLNISVPNYQTTYEEGTVTYTILVEYGGLSWEVWRRYSQFTQLYQDLEDDGYCALPRLPPKTLIGPPQDPDALSERRQRLQLFLRALLRRPDTRTSPQLLDFLLFNEQTNLDVEPLRPACVCSTGVQRFAASALAYSATRKLLVVGHEDKTGLSRLGRLWSVVEPDEFGLINFWRVEGDFVCLSLLHSFKTQAKVRCMHLDDTTGQLFVGHDDGNIAVYSFAADDSSAVEKVAVLPLHHAAVMRLAAGDTGGRRLLSIGYDDAMRVFEMASHRVVCGGRLSQRLQQPHGKSSSLTAALLCEEKDVAFLGTSAGQLLVYRVKNNPPEYMRSFALQPPRSAEALHVDKSLLYVAHGECVSLLSLEWRRDEVKFFKVAGLHLPGTTSAALCIAVHAQLQHLFVGYDPAIAWWSAKKGEPLCVFDGHKGGTHQLLVAGGGQLLISGGDSGNTKVWRLPPAEEMLLWEGRDYSPASASSSCSAAAAREQQEEQPNSSSSRRYTSAGATAEVNGEGRRGDDGEKDGDAATAAGEASGDEAEPFFPSAVRGRPSSLLTQLPPAAATAARAAKAAAATAAAAAERCIHAGVEYLPLATQLPASLCSRASGGSGGGSYYYDAGSSSSGGYDNSSNSSSSSSNSSGYNDRSSGDSSNYCSNTLSSGVLEKNDSGSAGMRHRSVDSSSSVRQEQHALQTAETPAATASPTAASPPAAAPPAAAPAAAGVGFLRPLVGAGTAEEDDDDDTLNDLRSAFR